MAQTIVGVNLLPSGSARTVSTFNNVSSLGAASQLSSNLSDTSGALTGYTLALNGAFADALEADTFATSSPDARFPVNFFRTLWYVGLASDDAATFTLGNLPVGESYKIEAAAANGRTDRPTTFSATGSAPASAQYTPVASTDPVPQPVVLEGTVPASGAVVLSNIGSSTFAYNNGFLLTIGSAVTIQNIRKGSQFNVEETLAGNVVSATLNGNAITVDSHVGTTVTLTDTGSGITTSGEYPLVLTDDSATPATETITLQVNVYGVAPSNNPVQKDGAALASLTSVQIRVTNGANINGTELFYSGTATTDASGNLSAIDLSSTAAADTDPVLLHMRTAAGDSIIASETVGLI